MDNKIADWPSAVWCWHKAVHRRRWLISLGTGRIVARKIVPPDPKMRVAMAGWAKRCATVPVAVFTPDRNHLIVQRRGLQFDLRGPGVSARRRTVGPIVVLTLEAPGQRTVRVRDWIWSERFRDPMDDRFIDMIARLAEQHDFDLAIWNPGGTPPPGGRW